MASETEAAELIYEAASIEFDDETRRVYERIDQLGDKYLAAQERLRESGSDDDKVAYREAKAAYATARRRQRLIEVDREDHPRGVTLAHVGNED
jgi:hypothetical protein